MFPNSAHGVISDSWISSDYDAPTCGMNLLAAFLRDPESPVDALCIEQTFDVDFAGTVELAQYVFGTEDLWENPAGGKKFPDLPSRFSLHAPRFRVFP